MRSSRRQPVPRNDEQILASPETMGLLRAVADGLVVRGSGGDTGFTAPFMLRGESVRLRVMKLAREDLIEAPISGPPRLAPRGQSLLDRSATDNPLGPPI